MTINKHKRNLDLDLSEDEIIHIEIWNKHRDPISFLSITEVKLQKLQRLQNNITQPISERRCDSYAHQPSEYYKEAKGIFNIKHRGKENPKKYPRR